MQDVKTRIDIQTVAKVVAADITARFGHKVDIELTETSEKRSSCYATIGIEQNLGIFAMIIKKAEVHLRAEPVDDGTVWVLGSLNYNHVGGGRNGSNIGTWWVKDGAIVGFRAG